MPSGSASNGTASDGAPSSLDYGSSLGQLDMINVITLHDVGLNGQGILIAVLDTGFNRRHESLIHLDVVAERDFVNNDPVTENEPEDPYSQHNHGTAVLSVLAGYAPGNLIGPAWGASFALAKTEQVAVEIQQEEDDYVSALEWADSLGASIVSSSLGYYDWYTYEDMDGNTAVTTIAADIAAAHGITVITAAGNEGPLPWPGIIAPADGDSVVAVGGVESSGVIWSSSSRGPTFDGRIKPDVCAQAASVYVASAVGSTSYYSGSGTSFATPLVAGAAALCLQMNPEWTPIDLRDALRSSGDHSSNPDNEYGWGIIDAHMAALYGATGTPSSPPPAAAASALLFQNSPNPFIPSVSGRTAIRFRLSSSRTAAQGASGFSSALGRPSARRVSLSLYDVKGRLVRRLYEGTRPAGDYVVEWDGLDERGIAVSSSVYYYRLSVGGTSVSKKLVLIRR
jgi:subtilisin family serine protease